MTLYFNTSASSDGGDWTNLTNWWDAPAAGGSNGFTPNEGDTLIIETECAINIPSTLPFHLDIQGPFILSSTTAIPDEALGSPLVWTVSNTLTIDAAYVTYGGTITLDGGQLILTASSIFTPLAVEVGYINVQSSGSINIHANSTFQWYSGQGYVNSTLTNNGTSTIDVPFNGTIYAEGGTLTTTDHTYLSIYMTGGTHVATSGTITDLEITSGTSTITDTTVPTGEVSGGTLWAEACTIGTLTVQGSGTVNITDGEITTLTNTNNVSFSNSTSSTESLVTTINNSDSITVAGRLRAVSITNNSGATILVNDVAGDLKATSSFNNSGNVTITAGSINLVTPHGLYNYSGGVFTWGTYTTRMVGRISPQIPSSASWGNVFI